MLIENYVRSAMRNILRHKLFSIINILGLAIGLAAVMLIALYVKYETSYDSFWKNADNIYRIQVSFDNPGRDPFPIVLAPTPLLPFLKKDFPEIETAARINVRSTTFIQNGNSFPEHISLVDSEIIDIFDFKVIAGNIKTAINDNNSVILSQKLASKYFNTGNPINQIITLDHGNFTRDYKVTAVIEDIPANSQLNIDAMIRLNDTEWSEILGMSTNWFGSFSHTYYTTKPGTGIDNINNQMVDFMNRNYPSAPSGDPNQKPSDELSFISHNIKDLHLKATGVGGLRPRGNYSSVLIFSSIAVLILIIASINFTNLTTARASRRAKEVSLRKVVGATRSNIISQFLGEAIILTLIGLLTATAIVELSLPYYNELIGRNLSLDYSSNGMFSLLLLVCMVGFVGGIYPAFVLSNFRPSKNLSANNSTETKSSINLRSSLVIVQFTISISLFVSTAVVYSQLQYSNNINLGFTKENLLVFRNFDLNIVKDKFPLFVEEMRKMPEVEDLTWSRFVPGDEMGGETGIHTQEMSEGQTTMVGLQVIGYDFFKTYKTPILSGRTYDKSRNDVPATYEQIKENRGFVSSIVLNNSAVRLLGLGSPEEAVGKFIDQPMDYEGSVVRKLMIIGVVADTYMESLRKNVRPQFYHLMPNHSRTITIRYTGDPQNIINLTHALWKQEASNAPFNQSYLIDDIAELYNAEQGQMKMFAAFSALAIFIACLGLFGLASFTAERRTKEIGIRKVFGAEVFQIVKLLVWQFTKPVIIANLIAWPLSFYTMNRWLESFVYRIDNIIIIAFCLIAGLTALLIAWATVAGNSYAAARQKPINALRYE